MKSVRSMRGEFIDMAALVAQNSNAVALGNARMNARGDIVDRSGNILKTRDTVVRDYYNSNPRAVKQSISIKDLSDEVLTPRQAIEIAEKEGLIKPLAKKRKIVDEED